MKTVTMTKFRKQPGEYILDVVRDGESYLLTKAGRPVAKLVPVNDDTEILPDGKVRGPALVTRGRNLGGGY